MNIIIQKIIKYLFHRLTEFSTWRGIILILAGTWGQRNPDTLNTIINQTFIIVGLLGSMLPDKIKFLKDDTADNQLKDQIIAVVKEELNVNKQEQTPSTEKEPATFLSATDIDGLSTPTPDLSTHNILTIRTETKRVQNQPSIPRTTRPTENRTETTPFGFNDK